MRAISQDVSETISPYRINESSRRAIHPDGAYYRLTPHNFHHSRFSNFASFLVEHPWATCERPVRRRDLEAGAVTRRFPGFAPKTFSRRWRRKSIASARHVGDGHRVTTRRKGGGQASRQLFLLGLVPLVDPKTTARYSHIDRSVAIAQGQFGRMSMQRVQ